MPYCCSKVISCGDVIELVLPSAMMELAVGLTSVWKDMDLGGAMVRPRGGCIVGLTSFIDSLRPERARALGALPMLEERDEDCDLDRLSVRELPLLLLLPLLPLLLLSMDEATTGGSRFSAPKLRCPNMACGWKP